MAVDEGIGILVWSPLAGGLLSGKFRRGERGRKARARCPTGPSRRSAMTTSSRHVEVLVEVGEAHGVSAAQVALAWLLGRPGVVSLIIGARTDEQLEDNLAAVELKLSDDERARLEEVSRPPLIYPHWHQARTAPIGWGTPIARCWIPISIRGAAVQRDSRVQAGGRRGRRWGAARQERVCGARAASVRVVPCRRTQPVPGGRAYGPAVQVPPGRRRRMVGASRPRSSPACPGGTCTRS